MLSARVPESLESRAIRAVQEAIRPPRGRVPIRWWIGDGVGERHSYVGAGLLVWKDEKNVVRFERAVNGDSTNVFMLLEVFVNGEVTYDRSAACNDEPVQLRIVRKGRTFAFFRSDDGNDWKRVTLVQVPLTGKMQCGVMAVNATTSEFIPVFRKLTITPLSETHRDK